MLAEQLAEIVKNDQIDQIVPFLKEVSNNKKELLTTLKKLYKEYSGYIETRRNDGSGSWSPKAKGDQLLILSMTAFVCCDEKSFFSMYSAFILSKETMDKLLPWYCPPWFSSFISKYAQAEYIPFDYDLYQKWVENGYVTPSDELIAKLLPPCIFQPGAERFKHVYAPENLLKHSITLSEHIWLVFQHETFIHGSDRYISFSDGSKEGRWIKTFIDFTEKNLLNRKRVLREALLATNRNFNQALSGWFSQLFIELKPNFEEVYELRSELLNSLNSSSSKQINIALKLLKSLIEGGQCPDNVIDHLHITINSNTKSIVTGSLACLEQLAKGNFYGNTELTVLASSALVHTDEAIQTRAAKFIQKYGEESSELLLESIQAFSESLFINPKNILSPFLQDIALTPTANSEDNEKESQSITTENIAASIAPVVNFDELMFLASQAFDNNESWHLDHLVNSLLRLQNTIKGDNIHKLTPALQRAFKLVRNDFRMGIGFLDHLLATFFIEYFATLIERFPANSVEAQKLFYNFYQGAEPWKLIKGSLAGWQVHSKSKIYQPYKNLLLDVLDFLKQSKEVPLLCAPDLFPCRVSADSLVDRLKVYQEKKITPSITDLEIAVSRILISDLEALRKHAEAELEGEFRDLITYLATETLGSPRSLKPAWLVASIRKAVAGQGPILTDLSTLSEEYLIGSFEWTARSKQRYLQTYDMKQQKYVDSDQIITDRELRIVFPEKMKATSGLNKLVSKFIETKADASIYDFLEISGWISAEAFDIKRLLFLVPDNPSPILAQIMFKCLVYSKCWEEPQKRMVIKALEALLETGTRNSEMVNLFIAACMLNSDKTISGYAAELWLRGITTQSIDNEKIGRFLGILEESEYGPLKRLTDLILNSMYKISPTHNTALETLLVNCISRLSDEPINNTKKLLDIFRELLSVINTKPNNVDLISKLNKWRANPGLKKTIESILH